MALWLSEVSAQLWKCRTGEKSIARQFQAFVTSLVIGWKAVLHELETSAISTVTPIQGSLHATQYWRSSLSLTLLPVPCFSLCYLLRLQLLLCWLHPQIERMLLTLQRIQSRLLLKTKYSPFLQMISGTCINYRRPMHLLRTSWKDPATGATSFKMCVAFGEYLHKW